MDELRLKSQTDLHKLWYIILKEKNGLLSDWHISKQTKRDFPRNARIAYVKCQKSMSRIISITNERKVLSLQFQRLLEEAYIHNTQLNIQEQLEKVENMVKGEKLFRRTNPNQIQENIDKLKRINLGGIKLEEASEGKESEGGNDENLGERWNKINEDLTKEQKLDCESGEIQTAIQNPQDIDVISMTYARAKQKEILPLYIENYDELNMKHKRKLLSRIQAHRAMQAKQIFLKELGMLGDKYKGQEI